MAAKPQESGSGKDVIAISNGFPSGEHHNLNIHGKTADYVGDPTPGGKSVFVLEYCGLDNDGLPTEHIQYVSNKKASLDTLTVLDPLTEAFDDTPAKVQLPYEADGYYVFGRILGKPNNGNQKPESSIILYPNQVVGAYNDVYEDPDFGTYTGDEEALLNLGLIVGPNLYVTENETYVRFDPETTKGKGNSKATNITDLFTYTGWVVDSLLDTNGPEGVPDGIIDIYDVPAGYTVPLGNYDNNPGTPDNQDFNNDGVFNDDDIVESWLTDNLGAGAWYFDEEWILNIADLVVTEQGLVNDGTKLLQIRFYPVDTTVFIP
jgi:hypothetical protein